MFFPFRTSLNNDTYRTLREVPNKQDRLIPQILQQEECFQKFKTKLKFMHQINSKILCKYEEKVQKVQIQFERIRRNWSLMKIDRTPVEPRSVWGADETLLTLHVTD